MQRRNLWSKERPCSGIARTGQKKKKKKKSTFKYIYIVMKCLSYECMLLLFPTSQVALVVKNPTASAGDTGDVGLILGSGRLPGEGNGYPLQYPCLENSMDRGAWRARVHGVANRHNWASFKYLIPWLLSDLRDFSSLLLGLPCRPFIPCPYVQFLHWYCVPDLSPPLLISSVTLN